MILFSEAQFFKLLRLCCFLLCKFFSNICCWSSLFSHSVMSDSLWPHGLQHARLPCPSPSPGVCSESCPLSRWWHTTTSSSVVPFYSCPPSFPASGSFSMSQFFPSGGQSIGVLASASVLPMNIQGWFPLGWTGLISLLSNGLSEVSNTTVWKHLSAYPWESNCKLCVWNDVTHDCLVRGWCQCNTELQHRSRCTFPRWYILRWSEAELHTFLVCSTRWCYLICKAFKTCKC